MVHSSWMLLAILGILAPRGSSPFSLAPRRAGVPLPVPKALGPRWSPVAAAGPGEAAVRAVALHGAAASASSDGMGGGAAEQQEPVTVNATIIAEGDSAQDQPGLLRRMARRVRQVFRFRRVRAGLAAAVLCLGLLMAPRVAEVYGPRVQESAVPIVRNVERVIEMDVREGMQELGSELQGSRRDVLILLLATAGVIPTMKALNVSPILGFLFTGCLMGPSGLSLVSDVKTIETLAELGIVFFLFEMGLELSLERLVSMRRDVFGLGFGQMAITLIGFASFAPLVLSPELSSAARVVMGAGLALSSSAFVLQLLRDKDELNTRHGRAAFGILLFQDLAVVPVLVAIPLLAGGGGDLISALRSSLIKSVIALSTIAFIGRVVLDRIFFVVAKSKSQEAFLALILLTVMSMSSLTEGLGLSNTLGAFLAGVLLSETKYRYQVEADIVPFRGLLLGLFFITVGFEIDTSIVMSHFPHIAALVTSLVGFKAAAITVLCMAFKMNLPQSLQAGLLLAQGGEFAFVAFGLARRLEILTDFETKLLLTATAISMALTPVLSIVGESVAQRLESKQGFSHYVGEDGEAEEIKRDSGMVVVCGYGRIGKVVCEVLDRKLIRYIVFEVNPIKAIEARNRGLPVFYGDVSRPEVLQNFNVGNARLVITTINDRHTSNRAIVTLRRMYPDLKILARAADSDHQKRLQSTLNVMAMVPVLPEDSFLLNLPFGGAVLRGLGYPSEEVSQILEDIRKKAVIADEEGSTIDVIGEDSAEFRKMSMPEVEPMKTKSEGKNEGELGYVTKSKATTEGSSAADSSGASTEEHDGSVETAVQEAIEATPAKPGPDEV